MGFGDAFVLLPLFLAGQPIFEATEVGNNTGEADLFIEGDLVCRSELLCPLP
jgi:hypothetical protein